VVENEKDVGEEVGGEFHVPVHATGAEGGGDREAVFADLEAGVEPAKGVVGELGANLVEDRFLEVLDPLGDQLELFEVGGGGGPGLFLFLEGLGLSAGLAEFLEDGHGFDLCDGVAQGGEAVIRGGADGFDGGKTGAGLGEEAASAIPRGEVGTGLVGGGEKRE